MRRRSLASDTRAAVYVEFLVVFMPVFTLWLGMTQIGLIFAADVAVQHAADAAARSAIVVLPDDPARYGGPEESPKNQISWSDEGEEGRSDPSGLAGILGASFANILPSKGDARLNVIRTAAYKPLIAMAPTPSQAIDSRGSDSVRDAIGAAHWRFAMGLAYNLTAVAVTFPSGPGAEGAQIDGVQNFAYSRGSGMQVTARVTYLFNCSVPFAAQLMCDAPLNLRSQSEEGYHELGGAMYPIFGDGGGVAGMLTGLLQSCFHILRRESTLLYQGAEYEYASEQGGSSDHDDPEGGVPETPDCRPASTCERTCRTGVACGNTCISAMDMCSQPRGTACNASEICP